MHIFLIQVLIALKKNLADLKNSSVENRLLREQLPAFQVIKSLKVLGTVYLKIYEESISIPKVVIVSYSSTDIL